MSAGRMLLAMIAGSALVMTIASRGDSAEVPAVVARAPEVPWLSKAAAAEIFGDGLGPGPLFAGAPLGGPAPAADVRARIAAFARANDVRIDLDVVEGHLAAIRFDVTFGGCCGYEGVDVLALRLRRPSSGGGCMGGPPMWIDDWTTTTEDGGVHMRARARINHLHVRWEHVLRAGELLTRAEALLGADAATVAHAAGERWNVLEPGRHYLLEVPFQFATYYDYASPPRLDARDDLGFRVTVERGRITEVSFGGRGLDVDAREQLGTAMRARWGKPRITESSWTWSRRDRVITSELDGYPSEVTLRAR